LESLFAQYAQPQAGAKNARNRCQLMGTLAAGALKSFKIDLISGSP
jgi:hypothetical protein